MKYLLLKLCAIVLCCLFAISCNSKSWLGCDDWCKTYVYMKKNTTKEKSENKSYKKGDLYKDN